MSTLEKRLDLMDRHGLRLKESELFESKAAATMRLRRGGMVTRATPGGKTRAFPDAFKRKAVAAARKAVGKKPGRGWTKKLAAVAAEIGVNATTLRKWMKEVLQ